METIIIETIRRKWKKKNWDGPLSAILTSSMRHLKTFFWLTVFEMSAENFFFLSLPFLKLNLAILEKFLGVGLKDVNKEMYL